ncbi:cbb3-type cytochrome oxidase subunit 3 [Pseudoblastomonas halimionae]|uniref:CcoQ/FixQ family Cbb3-type cytochrome c oxidase assembly chaperone n=1 Tax=Alteriqipengyuania halimionae TaxID=1926630 RepID=A0A6I4U8F9_9SPHN|nr:cbb3-type cytochrome c oxidase subunit 3 [Alteriqipengyuania halimionae]MXP10752.1 CcoQ/FixQ family Cbb3-type cytochrome c oxidase assembly chaperone [Alteriqipengyuania halimionae]
MTAYDTLRHLADSYALIVMFCLFVGLCAWPFRPGAKTHNRDAAQSIFEDENDGE